MKILIYMVLAVLALVAVLFIGVAVVTFYRLATGRISKEEQERILEADRRMKEDKRKRSKGGDLFHFLSYPSPLNHWGLWH
ncbi:MAG: hypothetical protein MJZ85_10955 [Bacteroidales bacterium]|nr:hypothetical protein [Bacteroidales bacterium]